MTKEEFQKLNPDETLVLDVREAGELAELPMVAGSVHMPLREVMSAAENGTLPKNKKVVTLCVSGGRCMMLNHILEAQGYDADYLEGGIVGLSS